MHLFDYVDKDKLGQQIADGMIKDHVHPRLPLRILNYTQKAQFTPALWNDVTDKCRGLIYNAATLEIVARGFVKFWNYADSRHSETMPENFPASVPFITRKYDGSLGVLYCFEGPWAVATRGSFTSDQATWATRWLNTSRHPFVWPDGFTPLVEIIYPENQIVVNYEWSGLVLLAGVKNSTGEEMSRDVLEELADKNNLRLAEEFHCPIDECVSDDHENEEGYVVSWPRQGTWPLRVKIKMETYCRLHKLLTQTNPVTIWEMLKDGKCVNELTKDVPKEFADWATAVESKLLSDYTAIESAALAGMLTYGGEKNVSTPEDRKQFALYATKKQPLTPVLFAMLDRKNHSPIIWKMIRPKGNETFKVDIDS